MEETMLTLEKFEEASEVVKQVTQETKLVYSENTSVPVPKQGLFKTGKYAGHRGVQDQRGFTIRSARSAMRSVPKGLITASAGNHAQGVAYAAKKFGVKAVIVMPTTTRLSRWSARRAMELKSCWKAMSMTSM